MSHEVLPAEILRLAFLRVPPSSLARTAQVCRQWRPVADSVYKKLLMHYFRKLYECCNSQYGSTFSEADWKNEFIRLYQASYLKLPKVLAKLFKAVREGDLEKLEKVIQEIDRKSVV